MELVLSEAIKPRVQVTVGDITQLAVDAIVNAANESLLGGGGVDGAIHGAAGPQLLAACRELGGCSTGLAKLTPGFQLPARFVIHTVGPVWGSEREFKPGDSVKLGSRHEDILLASCYQTVLDLARENNLKTIAFPCISTGVYRFPKVRAAKIALAHVTNWLAQNTLPEKVIFCCFSDADAQVYHKLLGSS